MNTLLRAVLAGAATGSRSQCALAAYEVSQPHPRTMRRATTVLAAAGELVADKLPQAPSRLEPAGLGGRVVLGAVVGWLLARRGGSQPVTGALAASAAATATSFVGAKLRGAASQRLGTDLPGALAEDAVALTLAGLAVRRG